MKLEMKFLPVKAKATFFILIVSLFTFLSCKKVTPSPATNYLKAINGSQVYGTQDFYIDNQEAVAGVPFAQSTNYAMLSIGSHQFQFKNSGSAATNASLSANLQGGFYTAFFADDNTITIAQDDRSAPLAGNARVRFINLSTSITSNLDIEVTGATTVLLNGLAYKIPSAYYEIANTAFTVLATGTNRVILNISAPLTAGHIYTIFISGTSSSTINYSVIDETNT